MSRSIRGSKGPGYDFWSRRVGNFGANGYGPIAKKITHRKERMHNKRVVRAAAKESGVTG